MGYFDGDNSTSAPDVTPLPEDTKPWWWKKGMYDLDQFLPEHLQWKNIAQTAQHWAGTEARAYGGSVPRPYTQYVDDVIAEAERWARDSVGAQRLMWEFDEKEPEPERAGYDSAEAAAAVAPPGYIQVLGTGKDNDRYFNVKAPEPKAEKVPSLDEQIATAVAEGRTGDAYYLAELRNSLATAGVPGAPKPPLKFRSAGEAQAELAQRGPGWQLSTTSDGYYTIEQVGEQRPKSFSEAIDSAMAEAFDKGDINRLMALDELNDSIMNPRGFTTAQAFSIASQYGESAEEFQKIFNELTSYESMAAVDPRIAMPQQRSQEAVEQAAFTVPGSVREASNIGPRPAAAPNANFAAQFPEFAEQDVARANAEREARAQQAWQDAYGTAYDEEIAAGEDPEDAEAFATDVANDARDRFLATIPEETLPEAPPDTQTSRFAAEMDAAIRGYGPLAERSDVRIARALQQGATEVFPGGIVNGQPDLGFSVLDVSGLSTPQRTRLFQTQPSEDLLLQQGSAVTRAMVDDPSAPVSGSLNDDGTITTSIGGKVIDDSAGHGFLYSAQELASQYGMSPQEIERLRSDAQARQDRNREQALTPALGLQRAGAAAQPRGFSATAAAIERSKAPKKTPHLMRTRFG